jgi:hypothetical protein
MLRTPTRIAVVAASSFLVVAASVLAVAASAQSGSRADHRNRPLHIVKECSEYSGGIGAYCTVTSSNLPAIRVGTRIFYAQAAAPDGSFDGDVILYAGRRNTATGLCSVDPAGSGRCTLSGGTGTLDGIRARVEVSWLGGLDFAWDGTYRFSEDDD